ncbi:MAG: ABC-F family ATP-binding cassette domain-containing protein [Planctomycetia bacterium]|nr:ABC-F family ATP-binding cassette domain-containing protein [Planctomycetia bacterium]
MILLAVDSLVKRFGPEPVLAGATLDVRPGERISLVGPNGTGKTTLLRIIAGLEEPDSGTAELHPSCAVGFLQQHAEFAAGETVWQVARQGLADLVDMSHQAEVLAHEIARSPNPEDRRRLAARFDRVQHVLQLRGGFNVDHQIERVLFGVGLSEACYEQPARQLSGGQQNRLLLARLLLASPDLLLLDEPSNHLDLEGTQWLEEFLVETEKTLIVVSHDRYFLDAVATRTLELFQGTIESYPGNFTAYWRQKEERLLVQERTYEKQRDEIEKMEEFVRRNHYGQKHAQAQDRKKRLEKIDRVAAPRKIAGPPMSFPAASRTGDVVCRALSLAKAFDRPLFSDLSFEIPRGQRWGMLGPNASGKTTLLRCIVGEIEPDAGAVKLAAGVRMGYLDQVLALVDSEQPAVEAVRPATPPSEKPREFNEQQRRDLLAKFGVTDDTVFQSVKTLSGGERSRTGLARLAAQEANFLVLDEPTNHLDIWARDALEQALLKFDGTVLLVSHDRYFLNRVVDHMLVVEGDRFRVIEGNYDDYLAFLRLRKETMATAAPSDNGASDEARAPSPSARRDQPARRKRRFPYRKLPDLEHDILAHEFQIEELHAALADPANLRDGQRVKSLRAQLDEVQAALKALYEHWEEAVEFE